MCDWNACLYVPLTSYLIEINTEPLVFLYSIYYYILSILYECQKLPEELVHLTTSLKKSNTLCVQVRLKSVKVDFQILISIILLRFCNLKNLLPQVFNVRSIFWYITAKNGLKLYFAIICSSVTLMWWMYCLYFVVQKNPGNKLLLYASTIYKFCFLVFCLYLLLAGFARWANGISIEVNNFTQLAYTCTFSWKHSGNLILWYILSYEIKQSVTKVTVNSCEFAKLFRIYYGINKSNGRVHLQIWYNLI